MKKIALFLLIPLLFACNESSKEQQKTESFKFNNPDFSARVLTPEILWTFTRLGEVDLSPDGKKVMYRVSYYSIEQNRSTSEIFVYDVEKKKEVKITDNVIKELSPKWRSDGAKIGFLAPDENGVMQVYEMNPDGTNWQKVTNSKESIIDFLYSPNLEHILLVKEVKVLPELKEIYPDLPKANAKIYTDLMFRHWDSWEDEYFSHIFVAKYDKNASKAGEEVDIMVGEPYDSPLKPLDGIENINWSSDGKFIAYTCKKMTGKQYALSTNSDIYLYNIETKTTVNLSEFNKGYDKNPVFSNNSKYLAWESMERDGYESDKNRLMIYDLEAKKVVYISNEIDQNFNELRWAKDDSKIYFSSPYMGTVQLFEFDLKERKPKQVSSGDYDYSHFVVGESKIYTHRTSMVYPAELFEIDLQNRNITQITQLNTEILKKLDLPQVRKYWVKTNDDKQMLVWIVLPPNFDSTKTYPALLYCQGGPQSIVSQFFSYRWNFHIMAANGYVVVAPNRRGVPGFGQAWNEQISKDFGGQDAKDLLTAIDFATKNFKFVDKNRLGAVGASYGGYSVFWLAGNHQGRFKAFIAHCGIFNFISMYGSTEELFFANWDYGNSYWAPTPKNSYGQSPHLFVKNWNTPILIIHGGKDYRVPETQAFEAFTAARLMGVDARLLYFPEENHWVLSPQNGILWQREFFRWLDKYLK